MKIYYDVKTDFMSITFEHQSETYAQDFASGVNSVHAEKDDIVVGYMFHQASKSILSFKEVTAAQKLAMLVKLFRKRAGLTQVELHFACGIPLPTIKMIELGENDTSVANLAKLKKVLPELDLNALAS